MLKNCGKKKKSGILMLFVAGFCTVFQRKAIIQFIENTKQISVQKIKVARYEENQIKRRIKGKKIVFHVK